MLTEALHHAQIAVYLDQALHGDEHNNTSASWHDLGLIHAESRNIDDALEAFSKSEYIDRKNSNRQEFASLIAWRAVQRMTTLADGGYVEEAAKFVASNIEEFSVLFRDVNMKVLAYDRGCQALQNIGEHALAQKYLSKAMSLSENCDVLENNRNIIVANMACLMEEMDRFDSADEYWCKLTSKSGLFGRNASQKRQAHAEWRARYLQATTAPSSIDHDVFISHSSKQTEKARALHVGLSSMGLRPWIYLDADNWEDTRSNENIISEMAHHISRSLFVLAIGSNTSFTSRFVSSEIKECIKQNVPLVVWYPDGIRIQPTEASNFSSIDSAFLRQMSWDVFRGNTLSIFGYGLRQPDANVISEVIARKFLAIYPEHHQAKVLEKLPHIDLALTPTRLHPVVLDPNGQMLFPWLGL